MHNRQAHGIGREGTFGLFRVEFSASKHGAEQTQKIDREDDSRRPRLHPVSPLLSPIARGGFVIVSHKKVPKTEHKNHRTLDASSGSWSNPARNIASAENPEAVTTAPRHH
jgi:hypothetical protein